MSKSRSSSERGSSMHYEYLTDQERLNLVEQRIRQLETDLFNNQLNELANVAGQVGVYRPAITNHEEALVKLRAYRDEVAKNPGVAPNISTQEETSPPSTP